MSVAADARLLLNFCCWVVLWAVLCVPLAHTQTGRCGSTFACVSQEVFRVCAVDTNDARRTRVPVGAFFGCREQNPEKLYCNENLEATEHVIPCEADLSPPCQAIGSLPFPDKPNRFYTCMFDGETYLKQFANCEPGFVLNATSQACEPGGVRCVTVGPQLDLSSCRHYWNCVAPGANATRHICPLELRYDPTFRLCLALPASVCGTRPI